MTLLVCWAGVDTHGTASTYIASDSRYSKGDKHTYDFGRKVFACKKWPDIFGYCGDVLFPSVALGQIVALADENLLFSESHTAEKKLSIVVEKLNNLLSGYPDEEFGLSANGLSIIHASRVDGKNGKFSCNRINLTTNKTWQASKVEMPSHSKVLFSAGSGKHSFDAKYYNYEQGVNSKTSRNVFHSFCDTLASNQDPTVGGAPQLVGLIRKPGSCGVNYGIIHESKRYFLGAHIDNARSFEKINWRNELFELCDGSTTKRFLHAQKQPIDR